MGEALRRVETFIAESTPKSSELDPGRISTREEAEIRVRQIRNGFWADFRPGDRRVANAHARMAVADEAFGLLQRLDLTPEQIHRATYLLIEARDRVILKQNAYDHFGRVPDLWADSKSEMVRNFNEAVQPDINQ